MPYTPELNQRCSGNRNLWEPSGTPHCGSKARQSRLWFDSGIFLLFSFFTIRYSLLELPTRVEISITSGHDRSHDNPAMHTSSVI